MAHRMIMSQRQPLQFLLFFPLVLLFSAEVWRFWGVIGASCLAGGFIVDLLFVGEDGFCPDPVLPCRILAALRFSASSCRFFSSSSRFFRSSSAF